jgi:PRC-barrel domain protein
MADTSTSGSGISGASSSGSVFSDETDELIASNKVEGTAVYNQQGERIGTLHHFMVGKHSGQVAYAVMSFGGLFGLGENYYPLPWNELTFDTNRGGYVIANPPQPVAGC